jgi:hypothetical protein
MVAEQAAEEFNVTWSRTTPVVVSCLDNLYLLLSYENQTLKLEWM